MDMEFTDVARAIRSEAVKRISEFESSFWADPGRGVLLSIAIARIRGNLFLFENDVYLREMIQLYTSNVGKGIPLKDVLEKIEESRLFHHKVRYEAEKFPWTEVAGDEVNDKGVTNIIAHIVDWYCTKIEADVYAKLEQALKKDAEDSQMKKIFRTSLEKLQHPDQKPQVVRLDGFEWHERGKEKQDKLSAVLHKELIGGGFIQAQTSLENLCSCFSGYAPEEKVQWSESLPHLIYLFVRLSKSDLKLPASIDAFIEEQKWNRSEQLQFSGWLYPRLCNTFTDNKGKELISSRLRNASNQMNNLSSVPSPIRGVDIDEIIKKLGKV